MAAQRALCPGPCGLNGSGRGPQPPLRAIGAGQRLLAPWCPAFPPYPMSQPARAAPLGFGFPGRPPDPRVRDPSKPWSGWSGRGRGGDGDRVEGDRVCLCLPAPGSSVCPRGVRVRASVRARVHWESGCERSASECVHTHVCPRRVRVRASVCMHVCTGRVCARGVLASVCTHTCAPGECVCKGVCMHMCTGRVCARGVLGSMCTHTCAPGECVCERVCKHVCTGRVGVRGLLASVCVHIHTREDVSRALVRRHLPGTSPLRPPPFLLPWHPPVATHAAGPLPVRALSTSDGSLR